MDFMKKNPKEWCDKVISRIDPSFRYRWEIYNQLICTILSKNTLWVDIGCGNNTVVEDFGSRANFAVGIDIKPPEHQTTAPFICANLPYLPLHSNSTDFITLRFVVEHLQDIPHDFSEIERILKSNGQVLIITTNSWSPFIFLPRILPFCVKNVIIRTLYKISAIDIHPAFHKFNSLRKMKRGLGSLKLAYIDFIQDANYIRPWLFLLFFTWHVVTEGSLLKFLRTCIVAIFKKPN